MEFSFSLKIKATKEAVWAYYANIEKWYGSVNVKHTVSLESEDKQHLEFLSQVFSDVPQSIFILKNCLER